MSKKIVFKWIGLLACILVLFATYFLEKKEIRISDQYSIQISPSKGFQPKTIRTYVINLDRSKDRWKRISTSLNSVKSIEYERFVAVDGLELAFTDITANVNFTGSDLKEKKFGLIHQHKYIVHCPSGDIEYSYDAKFYRRLLNPEEFGCICSHIGLWQKMLDQDSDDILVLEDDAIALDNISTPLAQSLPLFFSKMPMTYDVTYLHYGVKNADKLSVILNNDYVKKISQNDDHIYLATAYFLSKTGAKQLLEYTKQIHAPIDDMISHAINAGLLDAFVASDQKYFGVEAGVASTIWQK